MDSELSELLKLHSIIRLATYPSRNVPTDSADEANKFVVTHPLDHEFFSQAFNKNDLVQGWSKNSKLLGVHNLSPCH
jgi:hypothetical protein